LCSFSPCVEQVQKTCEALQSLGFTSIETLECLQREFQVKTITMPENDTFDMKIFGDEDSNADDKVCCI
jgi:tRNA (adenine57-N1/adenine58-N1)-methyltransferase catalytic subunit